MTVTTAQRNKLHSLMMLLAEHRGQLDYPNRDIRGSADAATFKLTETQMRAKLKAGGHLMFDCSQAIQQLCHWAGIADPAGLAYRYAGFTGSFLHFLKHFTDPNLALVGGIVVYGPGTGEHASMVLEHGSDPLLWSHGHRGLDIIRLSAQRQYHRSPVTFCSIQKL